MITPPLSQKIFPNIWEREFAPHDASKKACISAATPAPCEWPAMRSWKPGWDDSVVRMRSPKGPWDSSFAAASIPSCARPPCRVASTAAHDRFVRLSNKLKEPGGGGRELREKIL